MTNNLYPLSYKPGIKRDGTAFQADFCTDGQWIRFQRGFVRKMGGRKGSATFPSGSPLLDVTNVTLVPTGENIGVFIGEGGATPKVRYFEQTTDFVRNPNINLVKITIPNNPGNIVWSSTIIIQNNNKKIVFLASNNLRNINDASNAAIFSGNIARLGNFVSVTAPYVPSNLQGLSGVLFVNPFLFVYGANGLVQWSKPTDPLDFRAPGSSINISNDNVIYGASIRGGTNSPTLLFWTLSTVVRLINTGGGVAGLQFAKDVISTSSSVMSSRSIVEYDGVFLWMGTNRFFIYNGITGKLKNVFNSNFTFDNIDMNFRQKVFAVKNSQYDEIWWFYPEKVGTPGRPILPQGEITHAIIYNIEDNCWYDTAISSDAGIYSEAYGFMCTFGRTVSTVLAQDDTKALWRHEYETFNPAITSINDNIQPALDVAYMSLPIVSYFVTPTISWAAFNPMKQLTGVNRWMEVITIEPDFKLMPTPTDMTVTVYSKQYAQDFGTNSGPISIPPPLIIGADPINAKIDIGYQGRHINFKFTTTMNFEIGQTMLVLGIGDGQ